MPFNFNKHFKQHAHRFFFNEKTYAHLNDDIALFCKMIGEEKVIALKMKSPYLTFVALLGLLAKNKTPVLLSPLETAQSENLLREQFFFESVLEDSFFNNTSFEKITSFTYPTLNQEQIALVVFSSGTTNTPKGIALSFDNLYFSALGFIEYFKQNEAEISLINLPHHHVGGLMTLFRAFFSGGMLTTNQEALYDFISMVPLQLKQYLNDPIKVSHLKKVRVILIGGALITESLKKEAQKHQLSLFETYGMSESTSLVTINGEVLPYRKVSLDSKGHFLIDGEVKCLGYFKNHIFYPQEKGWLKTNDIGEQTALGLFHFIKRADLIFISGGENINPLIVEEQLVQCPEIKEVALLGLPDEKWGQRGVLLFETSEKKSPAILKDLEDYAKATLHPYLVPKSFFECSISTAGIKPRRSELKKKAQELYLKNIFSFDYLEKKGAPLIVFLHGFLGDKEDLRTISEGLDGHYSLLYIDLPGHGHTKIEPFYSTQDILQKMADFILLFSDNPTLYGYSMGGRIALQLALHHLNVRSLILESTGLGLESFNQQKERRERDLLQFEKKNTTEDFLYQWYENSLFDIFRTHPSYLENIERKKKHNLSQWRDSQIYLSQGCFPLRENNLVDIHKSSFSLIYLYGEDDSQYASFAPLFLKSQAIKEAGHNPNKTHSFEINKILKNFL